jgi:hypothetical protein
LGLLPEQVQSKSSPSDRIHLLPVLERVARRLANPMTRRAVQRRVRLS